ncbi:MAG: hypothetical protein WBM09_09415 [Gallionella sp.]
MKDHPVKDHPVKDHPVKDHPVKDLPVKIMPGTAVKNPGRRMPTCRTSFNNHTSPGGDFTGAMPQ